tara:strand:+ start:14287 stop:15438 length:1152 start_codon:yes stop_codon:yes gene_type:complete
MDLSVVIVNYNVRYFLEQCILSVQVASENLKVEIIVVDNNSVDDSCKVLQEKYPDIILIENKANVGFSKANNQGVKIAKGDYVLILNPDTVVAEDTFTQILNFAKTKQNLGVLGVKLVDGSGKFLPESKRGIPTPRVSFNKLFGISSRQTGKYYATHLNENETGVVAVLVGAFMLLKKAVYSEVNGFDEDYFMFGEDIDLSYKILNKGYQNYYFSGTSIIHFKGESTVKDIVYLKYFHEAMKIFYKKHFKLNKIYDFIMSFGIKLWYLLKYFKFKSFKTVTKEIRSVVYFGENRHLLKSLSEKFELINEDIIASFEEVKQLLKTKNVDALIFDNDTISFKEIIAYFEELKNEDVVLKIHPQNTNFLIGSSSSNNQGQVEIFNV